MQAVHGAGFSQRSSLSPFPRSRLPRCVAPRKGRPVASERCRVGQQEVDLVLSSGFLAFAKHAGFLKAVSEADLNVKHVMGTSSGAYAGSLYCAGYRPEEIAKELCHIPPIRLLRFNFQFWQGFLLLDGVVERLRSILPPTFESLEKPLAVGVVDAEGNHRVLDSGPLPEAIAASGAIPIMFAPVTIPGNVKSPFVDGGLYNRTALQPWRKHSAEVHGTSVEKPQPALVHLISPRSMMSGREDVFDTEAKRLFLLKSRRSTGNFFSLGDYHQEMLDTYDKLIPSVEKFGEKLTEKVRV